MPPYTCNGRQEARSHGASSSSSARRAASPERVRSLRPSSAASGRRRQARVPRGPNPTNTPRPLASGHVDSLANQNQNPPSFQGSGGVVDFASCSLSPALKWPILSGVSLLLVRLFDAGQRRSHPIVADSQMCFAPAGVVLGVGLAPLFSLTHP